MKVSLLLLKARAVLTAAGFLCFATPGDAQKMTDLEKLRVKGNVRSIMETKYSIAQGADSLNQDQIISRKMTTFDLFGYETGVTNYQGDEVISIASYTFESEGRQTEMKEYKPDGTLRYSITYKYDDKGFRTEANYHWVEQRFYDDNREMSENYFEIFESNLYSRILFVNDYRGLCTEEKYLRDDGSVSYKYTHKYDFDGNKLVMTYFNSSGHTSWVTKYKYDRYKNLIESRVYKSNRTAVTSKYKHQYDLYGNWTSRYEERQVVDNVLTALIERGNFLTERVIEYY